jgi:hypothetical protein
VNESSPFVRKGHGATVGRQQKIRAGLQLCDKKRMATFFLSLSAMFARSLDQRLEHWDDASSLGVVSSLSTHNYSEYNQLTLVLDTERQY